MRIFKNTWFNRFADKEGISDNELKRIVTKLENGQFYADLGGGVYKMRVGDNKFGDYRIIVIFKSNFRTFFVYSFPKSDKGNISKSELQGFKNQAKERLSLTEEQIEIWLKNRTLIEVKQEEENEIQK